ncbi:MAG: phosphoribosylamine--glycine ligase [Deltaproteobacteria bacterium]|nr:phosphoribosylamine--glycine ligase [Deltaproteobacteria bacterium]
MRIVVVGSGGREHALAWKLRDHEVFVVPGNGGTRPTRGLSPEDVHSVAEYCQELRADLVVVGPEAALDAGLVDVLSAKRIRAFGATRSAARLESSKSHARRFTRKYGVSMPEHWPFESVDEAKQLMRRLDGDAVLKFDGLAAGKGVWVCRTWREAEAALTELADRHSASASGVVERRLVGKEVSLIGLVDGRDVRLLAPARDHKRLLDGDGGPNTGGMGVFTPVPDLSPYLMDDIRSEIVAPTLDGFVGEGLEFCGFLYFGVLLSEDGPKLLEYNVRLGDPEAEVVLPALESDLLELMVACLEHRLSETSVRVSRDAVVDVVLASEGYPSSPVTGRVISGLDRLSSDTLVFHAGTTRRGEQLVTSGGRVLNVVARAPTIEEARARVYCEVSKIHFEGKLFRSDIGLGARS